MRLALAQVNPTVGDLEGNAHLVIETMRAAVDQACDLVAFPEAVITGYPPEDLVLKPSFISDNLEALQRVAQETSDLGLGAVVGFLDRDEKGVYNAAAVVHRGEISHPYHKHHLPNYGVFDEERIFEPGEGLLLVRAGGVVIGITICEDLWTEDGPHAACAASGAQMVLVINGSPYHRGKRPDRQDLLEKRGRATGAAMAYVNMVGGQDELVFDGGSMVVSASGELLARAPLFEEHLLLVDFEAPSEPPKAATLGSAEALHIVDLSQEAAMPSPNGETGRSGATGAKRALPPIDTTMAAHLDPTEEVYRALVLGVGDYFRKNGFGGAIVGLSGGIDSSLAATIAADALGPSRVLGVLNPSEFSAPESEKYAKDLAANLGIETINISIASTYDSFMQALEPIFAGTEWNVAEENLQNRIRATLWMAISNKSEVTDLRRLVLATGNKSELATGYATLYGDMAGGFTALKDVPKTLVYELSEWRNTQSEAIPIEIIERAPSAELRPGQLDTDSLPPYEVLDPIIEAYVEEDRSPEEIVAAGFDQDVVYQVVSMIDRAEFKRRQAPPGVKITEKAFGRDRRLPITNRYRPSPRS